MRRLSQFSALKCNYRIHNTIYTTYRQNKTPLRYNYTLKPTNEKYNTLQTKNIPRLTNINPNISPKKDAKRILTTYQDRYDIFTQYNIHNIHTSSNIRTFTTSSSASSSTSSSTSSLTSIRSNNKTNANTNTNNNTNNFSTTTNDNNSTIPHPYVLNSYIMSITTTPTSNPRRLHVPPPKAVSLLLDHFTHNSRGYSGTNSVALLSQLSKTINSPSPSIRSSRRHRLINDVRFLDFCNFLTSKLLSNDSYLTAREWCNATYYFGNIGCFPTTFPSLLSRKSVELGRECCTMEIIMMVLKFDRTTKAR